MNTENIVNRLKTHINDLVHGQALCFIDLQSKLGTSPAMRNTSLIRKFIKERLDRDIDESRLIEVSNEIAKFVVTRLLSGSYWSSRPSESQFRSSELLTDRFFASFDHDAKFYSTFRYKIDARLLTFSYRGSGLIDNSFESGIIVVDDTKIGIFWIGDED